ncbi:unnamed protein product [Caenorhabditis auriculariae]|uniref:Domain of unknown function DB domain-containing protein n=1 Tax=Caenorhabditis auriculariae TaxID=2777116 RepID=A0A8S1HH02_9PELO|nr:unnamed protein product [Caenorhabditis auriculariae]
MTLSSRVAISSSQGVVAPTLACDRFPPSFCCTTRVRVACPQQCAGVSCGDEFIHSLLSIDSPSHQEARDGNAHVGGWQPTFNFGSIAGANSGTASIHRPEVDVLPPPAPRRVSEPDPAPPPPPAAFLPSRETLMIGVTHPPGGFPTLIPFSPETITTMVTAAPPAAIPEELTTVTMQPRRRTTPDPRIIRPPDSLVIIGDYDEEASESENSLNSMPPPSQIQPRSIRLEPVETFRRRSESMSGQTFGASQNKRLTCRVWPPGRLLCEPRVATSRRGKSTPKTPKRHRKNFTTNRILMPLTTIARDRFARRSKFDRILMRPAPGEWKVALIRRGSLASTSPSSVPNFAVDGKSEARFQKFYRAIDSMITSFTGKSTEGAAPAPDLHSRHVPEEKIELEGNLKKTAKLSNLCQGQLWRPESREKVSVLPFRPLTEPPAFVTAPPAAPAPSPPAPAPPQCGVAPSFTPCVSTEVASRGLLECCRRKNLPAGCLPLCRYDVTQAEIRGAMDRGQCGIFSVAPFLECASQGKDNSECCRQRGVIQKTGPQCEQFCRPTQGLTALGIQHLTCGNVVGDMLHCHHSGIRP